ncbi:MAG: hypothetical protein E7224_06415 [Clostridiales bacterium]|nr:hypothetical protein [Clostridiales bacterium]
MTQTAFCSKVSVPLIRENLRRFWAIPALGFLVYFLSGVFPILLQYSSLNNLASTIEDMLTNMHPFFMAVHIALPIITAVMLFRYLQGSSAMAITHAMPFSRMKLYWTNVVTGLIMSLGPMVVTGLILLAIKRPAYRRYTWSIENGIEPENVFTAANIGEWMFQSAIIIVVIFAVAVFAGIVTGNSLLHFIMAIVFNFLLPGFFAVLALYCEQYLYGFNTSGEWFSFCLFLSPWLYTLENGGDAFGLGAVLFYVISFVVILAVSAILYKQRKLERVSDPLVFAILRPIIIYLAAFFVMTLMSFYFEALGGGELFRAAGYIVGALIGFIIASMLIYKTVKIFNLKHLKNLGFFAVVMILVVCSFSFDFYGFEKRIPETSKVGEVYIGGIENMDSTFGHSVDLSSPENLQNAVDLHQFILENRDMVDAYGYDVFGRNLSLTFNYTLKNGREMSRRYSAPYSLLAESPAMEKIYESAEFKDGAFVSQMLPDQLKYVELTSRYKQMDVVILDDAIEIRQLLKCVQADYAERSFDDVKEWVRPQCGIGFSYYELDAAGNIDREEERYMEITIDKNYTRTLAWLSAHEEASVVPLLPEDVSYILVQPQTLFEGDPYYVYDSGAPVVEVEYYYGSNFVDVKTEPQRIDIGLLSVEPPESYPGAMVITDLRDIQEILDTGCMYEPNMPLYYKAVVVLKEVEPYADEYPETFTTYFTEEKVPDWIASYFAK